ncbi:MAG: hypothetical protein EOM59_11870 [Clostridia bacterium]|nr:hypothetical protein [Clostridia bacterium]
MAKPFVEKYLRENGRKLPIHQCLVADGYDKYLLTLCLITRRQPSGYLSMAFFMIDRYCLGIKNVMYSCNMTDREVKDMIEKSAAHLGVMKEVSPVYFHNLVYGALDYAESIGFAPEKDFEHAEYLLNPELADDGIDEIEFGMDGKPYFMSGPDDNVQKILNTLNRTVGEGNYIYTYIREPF